VRKQQRAAGVGKEQGLTVPRWREREVKGAAKGPEATRSIEGVGTQERKKKRLEE